MQWESIRERTKILLFFSCHVPHAYANRIFELTKKWHKHVWLWVRPWELRKRSFLKRFFPLAPLHWWIKCFHKMLSGTCQSRENRHATMSRPTTGIQPWAMVQTCWGIGSLWGKRIDSQSRSATASSPPCSKYSTGDEISIWNEWIYGENFQGKTSIKLTISIWKQSKVHFNSFLRPTWNGFLSATVLEWIPN